MFRLRFHGILVVLLLCGSLAVTATATAQDFGFGTPNGPRKSTFANLSAVTDGAARYCTDCTPNTSPCTGSGSGAFADRVGSAWVCRPVTAAGSGTVTSVGLAGTANQITITGASPITTSGSWTLSFPVGGVTLPGATVVTTINGNTFTTGTYTLTGAASKTLTFGNSLTLAGTDSTTMTFPSTSATIARTDATNTFTGHQTIEGVTSTGATGTGLLVFGSSPTIVTPTISSFTNATHNHQNAAGGGTLVDAAITFTAPALGAPTATTLDTTGTVGIGTTHSATAGQMLTVQNNNNNNTIIRIGNSDAVDSSANAGLSVAADTAAVSLVGQGTSRSVTRGGVTIGGWSELISSGGNGLLIGTSNGVPVRIYTGSVSAVIIDAAQNITFSGPSLQSTTAKTLTESSATAYVAITVANSSACSGYVDYTVFAADATNTQAKSGQLFFSTVANSSGTVTKATINDANTLNPVSSGTLTNTMTDTTAANTYTLLANAVSSLTQTTLNIKYLVHVTSGNCTVTAQ